MEASTVRQDDNLLSDFYRTNDMAMVTFLRVSGHPVQRVYWEGPTCYWEFRITDHLMAQVDEFVAGRSRIEPREYNRMFNQTKREFYDTNPGKVHHIGQAR